MHTTPTKMEVLKAMKICDIICLSSQDIADDSCYIFQPFK